MSHFTVLDPGHSYLVHGIDGAPDQRIDFVKREGDNYPGNEGAHGGPLTQGFLGACLDRCEYMNAQGHCAETDMIIYGLRIAIMGFEVRAARCRGTAIELPTLEGIQQQPTCPKCGHIQCDPARHDQPHWSEGKGAPDSHL